MIKRLKLRSQTSTRSDDNEEVMQKRIAIYHESTLPVIDWFRLTNRVIDVDTEGTPQQIFNEIKAKVEERQKLYL
jgi:adenylate kinase family enzyme